MKHRQIWLALFLLSQAGIALDVLTWWGESLHDYIENHCPWFFFAFRSTHWLEAPLLLLYIRAMVHTHFKLRKLDILLLLPFFLAVLYYIFGWLLLSEEGQRSFLARYSIETEALGSRIFYLLREGFRVGIGVLCILELKAHRQRVRESHSNLERIDLVWLQLLAIGFLTLRIYAIVISLGLISKYELFLPINTEYLGLAANYILVVFLSLLIYYGLTRSSLFAASKDYNKESSKQEPAPIDEALLEKLSDYMEKEKPYLDHYLRLEKLAELVDIPARTLSSYINRSFGQNFFEYVNEFRVQSAKSDLESPKLNHLSIMQIMEGSGFNSKATFNNLFKKRFGQTPSQYRKAVRNQ